MTDFYQNFSSILTLPIHYSFHSTKHLSYQNLSSFILLGTKDTEKVRWLPGYVQVKVLRAKHQELRLSLPLKLTCLRLLSLPVPWASLTEWCSHLPTSEKSQSVN